MRLSRANSRDGNEQAIVQALRSAGASVFRLDRPVDLLVGFRGATKLLEVKDPAGRNRITPGQADFLLTWRGEQPVVVRSIEEALAAIGASVVG